MKFGIIENNTIINIIEADEKFVKNQKLNAVNVDDTDICIGAKLIDGEWINQFTISKVPNETLAE